jgi:DNA helicase-2/ATP-dependent DNA helicase PcrA
MFLSAWRDGLDDAQLDAVQHGDEPLIVLAGAGTGKTRTLTSRVASLLERGVAPERVLLLTFTRRAAADMLARAGALCGDPRAARRLTGGTFHAIAHRLVSEHAEHLGLPATSVLDPHDVVDLLDLMREEYGLSGTRERFPSAQLIADVYSRAVNSGTPIRAVMSRDFPVCIPHADRIAELLRAFMARKRAGGQLDFDDLLIAWLALLAEPTVGPQLRARWDHVLVDEYQDVNQVQVDIVSALRPDGRGLTVVGDDAQAIYGFRGAHPAHLLALSSVLPSARTVRLERNFRSLQPLLDLANVIRPGATEQRLQLFADRVPEADTNSPRPRLARCYDAGAQATAIAEAVLRAREEDGLALREQAVLMRAAGHSRELEAELTLRRIPYVKYGGLKYIETAHVRDFVAVLRLQHNRRDDVAWYRLLNLHRHIGKIAARTLVPLLVSDDDLDQAEILSAAPARSHKALGVTLDAVRAARSARTIGDQVQICLDLLAPLIKAHYADNAARQEDLDALAAAAQAQPDLAGFLAQITLDPASKSSDYAQPPHIDDDYLVLSTVHSAKGLEWPVVHLLNASDGAFPSDMALTDPGGLDEEHRLFYVALTRARDQLTIYHPQRLYVDYGNSSDRHVYPKLTRFLTAEALNLLDISEDIIGQPVVSLAARPTPIALPTLDSLLA